MSLRVGQSLEVGFAGGQISGEQPAGKPGSGAPVDGFEKTAGLTFGADPTILFQTASPSPAPSPSPSPGQPANPSPGGSTAPGGKGQSGGGKTEGGDKSVLDQMKNIVSKIDKNGVPITDNVSIGGSLSPPMVTVTIKF